MSYIKDLEKVEWWHVADLAYNTSVPENFDAVMVGWLGDKILVKGNVHVETMKKLEWAYDNRTIDQAWLGEHECEICKNYIYR